MKALLILSLILLLETKVFAAVEPTAHIVHTTDILDLSQQPAVPTTDFFTLREPPKSSLQTTSFQGPMDLVKDATETLSRTTVSLLDWVLKKNMPLPAEMYQRVFHFGRWINDPTDDSCMNTRAKVLVRDSAEQVVFKTERNCAVAAGRWADPYAGRDLFDSHDIQIDHVVPLKAAYVAGAWKWDFNTRCLYANFLGSKYHLMSVSGHENMSKGDKSPDRYMPPSSVYRCEYLKVWLKIKATWKLAISLPEAEAIQNLMEENNCSRASMVMGVTEIRSLRNYVTENINYCTLNRR